MITASATISTGLDGNNDGGTLDGCYVTHEQLMNGSELVFIMSDTPSK